MRKHWFRVKLFFSLIGFIAILIARNAYAQPPDNHPEMVGKLERMLSLQPSPAKLESLLTVLNNQSVYKNDKGVYPPLILRALNETADLSVKYGKDSLEILFHRRLLNCYEENKDHRAAIDQIELITGIIETQMTKNINKSNLIYLSDMRFSLQGNLARAYFNIGQYAQACDIYRKINQTAEKDLLLHAVAYRWIIRDGIIFKAFEKAGLKNEFEQMLIGLTASAEKKQALFLEATAYEELSMICLRREDYSRFMDYHFKAITLKEKVTGLSPGDRAGSFYAAAELFGAVGNYRLSLEYYRKCLPYYARNSQYKFNSAYARDVISFAAVESEAQACINMAAAFYIQNRLDSALLYSQRCIDLRKNHKRKLGSPYLMKARIFKAENKLSDAYSAALTAAYWSDKGTETNISNRWTINCLLSQLHGLQNRPDSMRFYFDKAKQLYAEIASEPLPFHHYLLYFRIEPLAYMMKAALNIGDVSGAAAWNDTLTACRLKLSRIETETKVFDGLVKYDSDTKEKLIAALKKEKELEEKYKRIRDILLVSLAVGVLMASYSSIRATMRSRERKKLNEALTLKQAELSEANEELNATLAQLQNRQIELMIKNQSIEDSLTYARHIQQTILPENVFFERHFPKHAILYRPKEIVSGDFYWAFDKHDYLLFGVADCTGHGVPGAFMSVVGNTALTQTVSYTRYASFEQPHLILFECNERMNAILTRRQTDEFEQSMDIAFCSYHPKSRKLYFAGASRSLIVYRNGKLYEYKGDPFSLGGGTSLKAFKTHAIDISPGDRIFLFTDGITDQIGGPDKNRFGMFRLKSFIESHRLTNMNQLEALLFDELTRWQNLAPTEQTDDLAFIAIEF